MYAFSVGMSRGHGIIILLGLIIGLTSCKEVKTIRYSEFEHIGEEGWDPIRILSFAPFPTDSLLSPDTRYSLVLTLRYSQECMATQLPVRITEQNDDGDYSSRIRKLYLRDKSGNLQGRKGLALYEITDTLNKAFVLPENYLVDIEVLAPAEYSKGLVDVGLELVEE